MYMDLGTALFNGVKNYYQAKDQQQALNQQQQLFQLSKQLKQQQLQQAQQMAPIQQQEAQAKLQALQAQLDQLHKQQIRQNVYNALDAYRKSSDPKVLDTLVKDPAISEMFGNVVHIEPISKQDEPLMVKSGIPQDKINKFRWVKTIDKNGNVNYIDMSTIYGITGYSRYAAQQDLKDLQAKLAAAKLTGGLPTAKERDIQRYADLYAKAKQLGGVDKLDPQEQAEYNAYNREFGPVNTDLTRKINYAKEGVGVGDVVYKAVENPLILKDIVSNDKNFNDVYTKAVQYQTALGKWMPSQTKRGYLETFSFLNQAKDILHDLNEVGPEDLYKGPIDELKLRVKTLLSDNSWDKMTPDEKRKALLSLNLNGRLGLLVKQYVKATSGLAASDKEFDAIKKIIEAGAYSNTPALKESIKTFYTTLKKNAEKKIMVDSRIYPADVLSIVRPYQDIFEDNIKQPSYNGEQPNESSQGQRPSLDEIFK